MMMPWQGVDFNLAVNDALRRDRFLPGKDAFKRGKFLPGDDALEKGKFLPGDDALGRVNFYLVMMPCKGVDIYRVIMLWGEIKFCLVRGTFLPGNDALERPGYIYTW